MPMDNIHERHDSTAQNESYAYEAGIASIDKIARENHGLPYFLNNCAKGIIAERREEFMRLSVLASYVSSVYGYEMEAEERMAIGAAFMKGSLTGECVSNQAYDDAIDITDTVASIEENLEQYTDDSEFYRANGPNLIKSGHQALDQMFACNDTLENWESSCVPDIRYHRFFRLGLGIYMASSTNAVNRMKKTKDLQVMSEQIDAGGIDWDQEFRNMM